jgi:serine/threonine protein kinase/Tfp pilus assembly protein PilF
MIGRTISHYRILEKLGEGGMGVVYKAEDTKLGRPVALKFLPPTLTMNAEARERFMQEARAASALDHRNICNIHDIEQTDDGQVFIAMAYYNGATLKERIERGPLKLPEALDIAIQAADGLARAHEDSITHRDIKPANIMITDRGEVKLLDFGLAKLKGAADLTKVGTTLGTTQYMSPEQARGGSIDHRTDIWSLGVVLYEMVTGRQAFGGEYEQAIIYSILNDEPEPVTALRANLPIELDRVIGKALAKNTGERYQTMSDLLVDLRSLEKRMGQHGEPITRPKEALSRKRIALAVGAAAAVIAAAIMAWPHLFPHRAPSIDSIAVLPLDNLSGDPEQEYFSDGMTEAIIKELSQIKALRVISRTSAMRYKSTDKTIPQIAQELGVDAVVEGSVLCADGDVRITTQLIAAHPERHLWAENFTRTLENVLLLQSEVAQAIAREIKVAVTPAEQARIASARVVNPEAHEAYLKGNYFWVKSTPADWYKSIQYFQQAIDKDSTYALAYAGMAKAYDNLGSYGVIRPRDAWQKVKVYAEKALSLDPSLAEGILLTADVKCVWEWDIKGAEECYKRAIELDPNLGIAHFWYGFFLTGQKRFEQGIAEMKEGMHLDPLNPDYPVDVGWGYALVGEYDSALAYVERAAEIDSTLDLVFMTRSHVYLRQGKFAEAIEEAEKAVAVGSTFALPQLALAYALSGQIDKALESIAKLTEVAEGGYPTPYQYLAEVYCALGDREKALESLEKAYQERDFGMAMPGFWGPWCDFIKSDPRYQDIMKKVRGEK